MKTEEVIKELKEAIKNVDWLLRNESGLADMHGIAYWAGVVEAKREELKSAVNGLVDS